MERRSLDLYHQSVARSTALRDRLRTIERNNQMLQEYQQNVEKYASRIRTLRFYEEHINMILKGSMIRVEQHRDECLRSLEARIEHILELLMPEEQFKVKITFKSVRGKYRSDILIGKEHNGTIIWGPPRTQNGDFLKQLISCSAVWSLNLMLDANYILMDEPFSSSDPVNVSHLQPVFDMMLNSGMEIAMIEHKSELYQNAPHHEICLFKHRHPTDDYKGFVEVQSCQMVMPDVELEQEDIDSDTQE